MNMKPLLIIGGLFAMLLSLGLVNNPPVHSAEPETTPEPINPSDVIQFQTVEMKDGSTLEYAEVLPEDFDAEQEYPILLAMPPGGQDKAVTEAVMEFYWAVEAYQRGWIVISPVAPDGVLFFSGSEMYIPELLDQISQQYKPEGGKFHLAGISNGGLSAFRIILNNPELFHSLMVLPGFPPNQEDTAKLELLKDIPVAMFVGELDSGWRTAMEEVQAALEALGGSVTLEVEAGEGHILREGLNGAKLFDVLDGFRETGA